MIKLRREKMKEIIAITCLLIALVSAHASEITLKPLKDVAPNAKCIFIGKILKVDIKKIKNGRRVEILVAPTKNIRGGMPLASKVSLTYTEQIPAIVNKSGKVVGHLSPILSGSGKEFTVKKGESWIFLLSTEKVSKILRIEAVVNENAIKKIMSQPKDSSNSDSAVAKPK
jgi:hypothetical protein